MSARVYGAYGAHATAGSSRSAYTGESVQAETGWYLLGNRPYSPVLRRFLSPDVLSPFGNGGLHRYAYCSGDPVNRIDPSGAMWKRWFWPDGQQAQSNHTNQAAPRPTHPASSNSSPATVAVASSSQNAAANNTIAIAPPPLSPSGGPGDLLLGAVTRQDGATSHIPAAPTAGLRPDQFIGARPPDVVQSQGTVAKQQINRVTDIGSIPAGRLKADASRGFALRTAWLGLNHKNNPSSFIWAADTRITLANLHRPLKKLASRGVTALTLYSGAHGSPRGENWTSLNGYRRHSDSEFYLEDRLDIKQWSKQELNLDVTVEYLPSLMRQGFRQKLATDGVHVMGFCFGIADPEVMSALNLAEVTVYDPRRPLKAAP